MSRENVGDWHCPVCRCGGTKGTEDMHARPSWKCEGVPMAAEQGWKVERVLDAARKYEREFGHKDIYCNLHSAGREVVVAARALDAPVDRYKMSGGALGGIWDCKLNRFVVPGEIVAALNAQERKP